MPTIAPPPSVPTNRELLDGAEHAVTEVFESRATYLDEEQLADELGLTGEARGKMKRLGRLVWEFKTADTVNSNRRIYPSAVFKAALEVLTERISRNVVFGNLDHPSMFDPEGGIIRLSDAAVKVVEVKMRDDQTVRVTVDIADNEDGRQLRSILDLSGNPGVSQRAFAQWREPTEEEIERHKIPDDAFVVVAEALRLITYDVVSEPGFTDAQAPKVTEHKGAVPMTITLTSLQKDHPAVYNEAVQVGVAQVTATIETKQTEAVEAAKPAIIEEATKPLKETIEAKDEELGVLKTALEAVKPILVKLGIVNEKITDVEAASKVATLEAKVTTLESDLATEKTAREAAETKAKAGDTDRLALEALKTVAQTYAKHPFRRQILAKVGALKIADAAKALEAAMGIADFIKDINPTGAAAAPAGEGGQPTGDFFADGLEALLHANPQDPKNGSGGNTNGVDNHASEQHAAAAAILGGVGMLGAG